MLQKLGSMRQHFPFFECYPPRRIRAGRRPQNRRHIQQPRQSSHFGGFAFPAFGGLPGFRPFLYPRLSPTPRRPPSPATPASAAVAEWQAGVALLLAIHQVCPSHGEHVTRGCGGCRIKQSGGGGQGVRQRTVGVQRASFRHFFLKRVRSLRMPSSPPLGVGSVVSQRIIAASFALFFSEFDAEHI